MTESHKNLIKFFKVTLNLQEDFIEIVDKNGNIIFMTDHCEEYFDIKAEKVIGMDIYDLYNPPDADKTLIFQALTRKKSFKNQFIINPTLHGKKTLFFTDAHPVISNGKVIGAIAINKDVSKIQSLAEKVVDFQNQLYFKDGKHPENGTQFSFNDIIGSSKAIQAVIEQGKKVASGLSPVLIIGETGSGKELFAQSIHNHSPRASEPFVAVNCSAIPENLLESILFGTAKGAFTGAVEKQGLFESSVNGTIFLDEINSMNLVLQAKILRILQTKKVRRIGSNNEIAINTRIISATNVDPFEAIKKGQLRNDLFFRLGVVTLEIPALRERKDDIQKLIHFFLGSYNKVMGKKIRDVSIDVQKQFEKYSWPGNVRELQHTIEHAMNIVEPDNNLLFPNHLPQYLHKKMDSNFYESVIPESSDLKETLLSVEKEIIIKTLNKNNGNISGAARQLNMTRQRLHYRMKKMGILPKPVTY